jgi:hypothetical protein
MSYIEPNTTIRLLHNVPLDTTYANTVFFNNTTEQYNYFTKLTKHYLPRQSYQRVNKGSMRVEVSADNAYDCNYLMFQNSNHGNRWFYAFITSVEYVNEKTCEIKFELDVMQTWFFDFTLEKCFVEREHTATDEYFEWIADEGLETGDYLYGDEVVSNNFNKFVPAVMTTLTVSSDGTPAKIEEGDTNSGGIINESYQGADIIVFTNLSTYQNFFTRVSEKGLEDGIVTTYMVPRSYIDRDESLDAETNLYVLRTSDNTGHIVSGKKYIGDFGGYIPKNKKLYCYPYNYLLVDTGDGKSKIYRYEFFGNGQTNDLTGFSFAEYCTITPYPVAMSVPYHYGYGLFKEENAVNNYTESISMGGFPTCGYAIDTYKAWLAQTAGTRSAQIGQNIANYALSAGSLAAGVVMENPSLISGGVTGLVNSALQTGNILAQKHDKSILPQTANQGSSDVLSMLHRKTFIYKNRHITYEYAKMIDDYFTMYGYAVKQLKVPNIHVRPHWTYCRTVGCNIRGSIPADDAHKICAIFDNGVTHWVSGDEIGNYSLDNSPA